MSIKTIIGDWRFQLILGCNLIALIYFALHSSINLSISPTTFYHDDTFAELNSNRNSTSSFPIEKSNGNENKSTTIESWMDEFNRQKNNPPIIPEFEIDQKENNYLRKFPCDDVTPRKIIGQKDTYYILYNYIPASRKFACDESITYSTHGSFAFLLNLVPLLYRWMGPISLTSYSPGTDFNETLRHILYMRECSGHKLIKELVTFHLFFDTDHTPSGQIPSDPTQIPVDCDSENYKDMKFGEDYLITTYRNTKHLVYPVNVARNVAREMSSTHFVLASDIELYPSPNIIPNFLEMIRKNDSSASQSLNPKIYVLPIFELIPTVSSLPHNKPELIEMLKNRSAIIFHKSACASCHTVPNAKEWMQSPPTDGLSVFHVGKRMDSFRNWEPIYISTKSDPFYDERLSWEGRKDKMTQGYILCTLDYEFHILDNAFLVHKPGIKGGKVGAPTNMTLVNIQNTLISKRILPEMKILYGTRQGCAV